MDKNKAASSPIARDRIWFRCTSCKEVHHGLPEISFELPEAVAVLGKAARRRRVLLDGDIAILDGTRYFLRATLVAPVIGFDHDVTWGVWVEAEWRAFKTYWERQSAEPAPGDPFKARLASTIAGMGATRGLAGTVHDSHDGLRPRFTLTRTTRSARHPLVAAQSEGVAAEFALEQARTVGVLVLVT